MLDQGFFRGPEWPQAVIFDLDGTLIDSAPDLANALNKALAARGFPPFEMETVIRMIGGGIPRLVERAFTAHGLQPEDMAPVIGDFIAIYEGACVVETRLYDGAIEMLEGLRARGAMLGLCTNKQQAIAEKILRELGLDGFFETVVGERKGEPRKPDPAPLRLALSRLGASEGQAVMIGDSAADSGCAQAAGVPVVLVDFGYSSHPPQALGPDAVIGHLSELAATLDRLRREAAMAERDILRP